MSEVALSAPRYYDKLTIKQRKFVQLYVTGGFSDEDLAKVLGVAKRTIASWRYKPEVKSAIAELQYDAHIHTINKLQSLSHVAVLRMEDLLQSPIDGVAFQAARDVLDRTGHKPKNEIKVDKTITTVEQKFKELIDSTIEDVDFAEIEGVDE